VKRLGLWIGVVAAGLAAAPAAAGAYRIVLAVPPDGKLLHGRGGLAAADHRAADSLVRVIAPGNDVHERGTLRILVMNLGAKAFEFGPDQVTLSLADGTVLKPVPVEQMEDGRELVEREMRHYWANDLRIRNDLSGISQQTGSGTAIPPTARGVSTPGRPVSGTGGHEHRTDEASLPGAMMLDSIYQLLVPLSVEPQKAWGGYYVFDMPKTAFRRKTDQPLTIVVRTGAREHRFAATLKWK
jgi:hypothetical protein